MKNRTSPSSGFTRVKIMLLAVIIGLLAAIAIPNFVHARTQSQKTTCINNLRQRDWKRLNDEERQSRFTLQFLGQWSS